MEKHLYFICPTDHLESVINKNFRRENYYCTSLGNSITFDSKTIEQINTLIETRQIREITFVLSHNNYIVSDALKNQDYSNVRGLDDFYDEIVSQKQHSEALWQTDHSQFLVLSYYLNKKIRELQFKLNSLLHIPMKINGKIYNRREDTFKKIYADLICVEKYYFN